MRCERHARGSMWWVLGLVLSATSGCGDTPAALDPVPTRLDLSADTVTLSDVGETHRLTATVLGENGAPIPGAVIDWSSSASDVAKVSDTGLVTAVSEGTVVIMAHSGSAEAHAVVVVDLNTAPTILELTASETLVDPESTVVIEVIASDPDGDDLSYAWTAEGPSVTGSGSTVEWTAPTRSDFFEISVTVEDGEGGSDVAQIDVGIRGFTLLVPSSAGILAVDRDGNWEIFATGGGSSIDVMGTRIFSGRSFNEITEFSPDGSVIRTIMPPAAVPRSWITAVAYPGGFALLDNQLDVVSRIDTAGAFLGTTPMPETSESSWQNVEGVWDGQRVIISETGTGKLVNLDVNDGGAEIFRDLSGEGLVNLGDVDFADGVYYLTASSTIIGTLPTAGGFDELTRTPDPTSDYNITGIVTVGPYLYSSLNFAGKILRTEIATGVTTELVTGLDNPLHIAFYPVDLVGR